MGGGGSQQTTTQQQTTQNTQSTNVTVNQQGLSSADVQHLLASSSQAGLTQSVAHLVNSYAGVGSSVANLGNAAAYNIAGSGGGFSPLLVIVILLVFAWILLRRHG